MKILIVASCFAPKNIIGAVRLSKIAKYMIRKGHEITVISPVLEDYDGIDNTLECEEFSSAKRITVPYSSVTTRLTRIHKSENGVISGNEVGNQISNSIVSKAYRSARSLFSKWRDYEWEHKVKKIIKADNTIYDIVFSSYPNVSAHDSAWYAKMKGKAKLWIADFRDPIVLDSDNKREKGRKVKRQSEIVKHSDITTFVTKTGSERFICYPEDKNKVVWLSNGFDPDDFMQVTKGSSSSTNESDKLVLSYAGGLYKGERDCSPLFQAIHELLEENLIKLEDIRFDYAGNDYSILAKQADSYDLREIITNHGRVSRQESIEMQMQSDCVVVITECYRDYGGALTGKIYEPVMMKKPILLIVNGNGKHSEPGAFVKRLNAGTIYEKSTDLNDTSKIRQMILSFLDEKRKNGRVVSGINETIREEYCYDRIVDDLLFQVESISVG